MRLNSFKTWALSCALALATACGSSSSGGHSPEPIPTTPWPSPSPAPIDVDGPPPSPTPSPSPATANYGGTFDVVSPLDLAQSGVLPGIVGPVLASLGELHDHPGAALYGILENSNIPTLSSLLMQIPAPLQTGLVAMLDDLIINNVYDSYPIADQIAAVIEGITQLASKIDVRLAVTVRVPANSDVFVDQQLNGVGFTLFGASYVAPLPSPVLMHSTGTLTPHSNAPVADADLSFSGNSVDLPLGALLLEAAGPLLFNNFGGATTLTGVLQELVPCAGFGQSLADATDGALDVSIGTALCDGALAAVGDTVTQQIDGLTLENIAVSPATATLLDQSIEAPRVDYQSDRIAMGSWSWTFPVAGSTITVPTTFAGDRLP